MEEAVTPECVKEYEKKLQRRRHLGGLKDEKELCGSSGEGAFQGQLKTEVKKYVGYCCSKVALEHGKVGGQKQVGPRQPE